MPNIATLEEAIKFVPQILFRDNELFLLHSNEHILATPLLRKKSDVYFDKVFRRVQDLIKCSTNDLLHFHQRFSLSWAATWDTKPTLSHSRWQIRICDNTC